METEVKIEWSLYQKLREFGIISNDESRSYNVGASDYSKHIIQPWTIIQEYNLNYWDGDIIKRVLRTKKGESRESDYEKIIHICKERIRQLKEERYNKTRDEISSNITTFEQND